jgi:uncharacterized protein YunC (DUF1805 family)
MLKQRKIKIGKKYITAVLIKLPNKNLIVFAGSKGYVMCGYLDLSVAEKFKDAAVRIVGVSNISQALEASVFSCTSYAKELGIYPGQPIKETLEIIA